jgi:integrase/recombinase XerD
MRIGEALGLRTEDVHLLPNSRALGCAVDGAHFHVNRRIDNVNDALAKSRLPRHLPVADAFVGDYRDYQYERFVRLADQHSAHLFVNYEGSGVGQPMSYSNVYKIVARLGRRCGFRATPHMFRHSAATAWVEAGSDVDVVQRLLGHASPTSTAIYLHASDTRMREAVTAVHASRRSSR